MRPRPFVGSATLIHLPGPAQGRSRGPIHPLQGPDLRFQRPGRRNVSVPATNRTPSVPRRTIPGCRRSSSMVRSMRTPAQRCRTYEIGTENLARPTCTVFLSTIFTAYSPHVAPNLYLALHFSGEPADQEILSHLTALSVCQEHTCEGSLHIESGAYPSRGHLP